MQGVKSGIAELMMVKMDRRCSLNRSLSSYVRDECMFPN